MMRRYAALAASAVLVHAALAILVRPYGNAVALVVVGAMWWVCAADE
jgi:hypothetical protein